MNREIKFRYRIHQKYRDREATIIRYYTLEELENLEPFDAEIETVLSRDEFTGLTDKNGKEIYEGDVFKYQEHKGYLLKSFVGRVVFGDDGACWAYSEHLDGDSYTPFCDTDDLEHDFLSHLEVIGNIYDNPELIKQL